MSESIITQVKIYQYNKCQLEGSECQGIKNNSINSHPSQHPYVIIFTSSSLLANFNTPAHDVPGQMMSAQARDP